MFLFSNCLKVGLHVSFFTFLLSMCLVNFHKITQTNNCIFNTNSVLLCLVGMPGARSAASVAGAAANTREPLVPRPPAARAGWPPTSCSLAWLGLF